LSSVLLPVCLKIPAGKKPTLPTPATPIVFWVSLPHRGSNAKPPFPDSARLEPELLLKPSKANFTPNNGWTTIMPFQADKTVAKQPLCGKKTSSAEIVS
jgi:hypothetical protein